MKIYKNIYCIVLFLLTVTIAGQTPRFDKIKILKNKNNYNVKEIFQDMNGYIWFGTTEGLIKHNGIDYQIINLPDTIKSKEVTAINQDRNGTLWVGFSDGMIQHYTHNSFQAFNPEEGLSKTTVSDIFFDSDNITWFSTLGEGIYCHKGNKRLRLYNLNTDDGLADNYAYCFAEDKDKNIYIGTDNGISVYRNDSMKIIDRISMKDGLPDNIVKHLFIDKNDIWIGMEDGGICKYNKTSKQFTTFGTWNYGALNNFICLEKNEIWISTSRRGLIRMYAYKDNPIYEQFNTSFGINSNNTFVVFADNEKNVWIGAKSGISKRKSNYFEFLDAIDNIELNDVFSVVIDNNNKIWTATSTGLYSISRNSDGSFYMHKIFEQKKYKNHSFISLHLDTEGYIWAGTYGYGAYKIDPVSLEFQHFDKSNGLCNNNTIHINDDSLSIWFSTLGGGIGRMIKQNGKFTCINTDSGIQSNYIYSTYTDNKCNIWFAPDGGGIFNYDKTKINRLNIADSLYSRVIYKIDSDKEGNIWFISADKGLYVYNGDTIKNYNESNGLRTNDLKSFTIADNGDIILVHNQGIDIFNPNKNTFVYYGENYNIANLQPGLNSIFEDKEGNIWIGHKTGLLVFKPGKYNETNNTPNIIISSKQLYLNDIPKGKRQFKYNQNHLRFGFIAFWYKDPESLKYRHLLDGYDMEWIEDESNRLITYSSLPPGRYLFKVQVSNGTGNWYGSENAQYSFEIKKPFWKRLWFIILVIILISGLIYFYIQIRLIKLKRDRDHLEEEVKKRTYEILMQKEEIEAQRDEIEAQRDEVTRQRDKIAKQNENITASIQYASRIQNAILPDLKLFKRKFQDYFIFNKPRDIVSGDFYFIHELDDGCTVVLAADCTGHGVPGAFMSILGMSQIKEILNSIPQNEISASHILEILRDNIKSSLKQTGKENEAKDGMDIALCLIDHQDMTLQYAGAYNPLYLIRDREISLYKGDRMPIGIQINENPEFSNHLIEIQKNDLIYIFSDGFVDQFGGEKIEKYKSKRFRKLLVTISDKSLKEQKEIVDKELLNWMGNNFQVDDILILGLKI